MSRHDTLIIKDTHRGLLYEDGVFQATCCRPDATRSLGQPSPAFRPTSAPSAPKVEVVLVDVRGRDRTVAWSRTCLPPKGPRSRPASSSSFRVADPLAAIHRVKNFEERLFSEAQTAARRVLRGLNVEEILGSRDEIGEEMLIQIRETADSTPAWK